MLNLLVYICSFILLVSIIVSIHEFGHYFFAKIFGVKVEAFSIGFGKELFGMTDRSGTRWKFCAIPAGGYVKMFGDADAASSPNSKILNSLTEEERHHSMHYKPLYQKALISFGGPLANFIFAIIVLCGLFLYFGKPLVEPVITHIQANSPAANSELKIDDRILKINGQDVSSFNDVIRELNLNTGEPVILQISRDEIMRKVIIKPELKLGKDAFGNKIEVFFLGLEASKSTHRDLNLYLAFVASVKETKSIIYSTLRAIGQMIVGKRDSSGIGGPIKIARLSSQSIQMGIATFLWFLAMISINLGLVNLFPIPVLDGGHLIFYLIEAVKGSAIAIKYQEYAIKAGFCLIIVISMLAVFNDIRFILK